MRSRARVLLSVILDQMNGECQVKLILIPVVYDALLDQQLSVGKKKFTLIPWRFLRVWNKVWNMHAWFSFHLSVPLAWDWNVEFILIRSLCKVLPYFQMPLTAIIGPTCCTMGPSTASQLWRNLVWPRMRLSTTKRPYSNLIESSSLWQWNTESITMETILCNNKSYF